MTTSLYKVTANFDTMNSVLGVISGPYGQTKGTVLRAQFHFVFSFSGARQKKIAFLADAAAKGSFFQK